MIFNKVKQPNVLFRAQFHKIRVYQLEAHVLNIEQTLPQEGIQNEHVLTQMFLGSDELGIDYVLAPHIKSLKKCVQKFTVVDSHNYYLPFSEGSKCPNMHKSLEHIIFRLPLVERSEYHLAPDVLHHALGAHRKKIILVHFLIADNPGKNRRK